jgi:hypothetical protein
MRQAFCVHRVSPSTIHRSRRRTPVAPLQPAVALRPYRACHVPATQEAQGEQDRTKLRAYPVPGRNGAGNASGLKMLEKREDYEGRASSLRQDTTRDGRKERDALSIKAIGQRNSGRRCNRRHTSSGTAWTRASPQTGAMPAILPVRPGVPAAGGGADVCSALAARCPGAPPPRPDCRPRGSTPR